MGLLLTLEQSRKGAIAQRSRQDAYPVGESRRSTCSQLVQPVSGYTRWVPAASAVFVAYRQCSEYDRRRSLFHYRYPCEVVVFSQAETTFADFPVYPGQPATWADYLALRDSPGETLCERETAERIRLFFQQGWLWVEMGAEGINHASVSDLFTMLFFVWSTLHPDQTWTSLGRCLLEKAPLQAGAPDLVLYQGAAYPRWQPGEPRCIDLHQWSAPLLVGEIADTTLKTDLEDKQRIYHGMGIAEYWVIDVQGGQVLGFQWQSGGYVEIAASQVLPGVSFGLLNQALQRLQIEPNTRVAAWLATELQP